MEPSNPSLSSTSASPTLSKFSSTFISSYSATLQHFISNLSSLLTIKLKNDNYLIWKSQFQTAIQAHSLQFLLDNSIKPPSEFILDTDGKSIPNFEYYKWLILDQKLLSCLFASVSETVLFHILNFHNSRDAWEALERKFSSLPISHSSTQKPYSESQKGEPLHDRQFVSSKDHCGYSCSYQFTP